MDNNAQPLVDKRPQKYVQPELRENQILLCTLNATYIHASLGLRYLYANLGSLAEATRLCEFTINQRPIDIAEKLLLHNPQIIGFGIYIWNVQQTEAVIALLKQIRPEIIIVIGGPEVTHEYDSTRAFALCDHLITGQADFAFRELCSELLVNTQPGLQPDKYQNPPKVLQATPPTVNELTLPYQNYGTEDLANRIIYVEASRGCPFKCEFCLSALDKTAYPFDLDNFLAAMDDLYDRGARQFKFVDRTFNLKISACIRILDFFLERLDDGLFLHFEVIPDKLPVALREKLKAFPDQSLQFEIGVQSFNPTVQATINRKQDNVKTKENIAWLRENTNAYIHADLIFGLPGETLASFADGFNQLIGLNPQEIQIGILKRLKGTTIDRHTAEFALCYAPDPPYALLRSRDVDFTTMQRMQRFARYWDMIGNSGRFLESRPIILGDDPFLRFLALSDWIFQTTDQTSQISLTRLFRLIYLGMTSGLSLCQPDAIVDALAADFSRSGQKGRPPWENNRINQRSEVRPPDGQVSPADQTTINPSGTRTPVRSLPRQARSSPSRL